MTRSEAAESPSGPPHRQHTGYEWANFTVKVAGLECSAECPACAHAKKAPKASKSGAPESAAKSPAAAKAPKE